MEAGARILALGALLAACGRASGERVVLVTIDTWRADALSEMPATSRLLANGLVFEHAYSATSTTQPSHASLLTGLHPWQHGLARNGQVLARSITTVAERLAEAGFATGAVVASFPLGERFGYAQGFQRFEDDFEVGYTSTWGGESVGDGRFYSLGSAITSRACALADELEGDRQFLWVHYFDPHDPYGDADPEPGTQPLSIVTLQQGADRPPAQVERLAGQARDLYRRDLRALDRALARLLEHLLADERFETHVIVTADHGESLGERGIYGHGLDLTPEQVHVPLGILSPRASPGRRADSAGSVDVARTLLGLAGVTAGELHGRDLLAPAPATATALGMRHRGKRAGSLDGGAPEGTRYFAARGGRLWTGDATRIFEDDDPGRPLEGREADELRAAFARFEALFTGTAVETLESDEVRTALRALGYAE